MNGPSSHACYLVTALAGVCALIVIDAWVLILIALVP